MTKTPMRDLLNKYPTGDAAVDQVLANAAETFVWRDICVHLLKTGQSMTVEREENGDLSLVIGDHRSPKGPLGMALLLKLPGFT